MSTPDRTIDLEALARPETGAAVPPPRRRWLWVLVPLLILLGFLGVFYDAASAFFTDPVSVSVVRPRPATSSSSSSGSVVFQTAGWIEPDPFPISVTALAAGVVQEMLIEESDTISAGDPVAALVEDDARIAVAQALATRAKARADAALARVERDNAAESFAAAIDVTRARDVAKADHRAKVADLARLAALVEEAKATLDVAEADLATQKFLQQQNAVGPWQVEVAQGKRDEAIARVNARRSDETRGRAEVDHAAATLAATQRDVELRLVEKLRVDQAKVSVERADAAVQAADAALADARLRQVRMKVLAPTSGVVLKREAQPGSPVGPASGPLCTLYDPKKLRVRVDVPQSQVSGASIGQRAEVSCDVRRGKPYGGRVIRIIDTADIAKVTLEVQVRILDPDGLLKPDMLCQVTVFSDAKNDEQGPTTNAVRIPARCVVGERTVWVVDARTGKAARKEVVIGRRDGQDVIVSEGLNVTDKVIDRGASRLEEGVDLKLEGDR